MEESAKRRRADLIEEIGQHRQRLEVLELAHRVPTLGRVDAATHKREIAQKLRLLNAGLHDLNVHLIREGIPANPVEPTDE